MTENVQRFHDAEPFNRRHHFRQYVDRHEHDDLYQGMGETALVIDATIYADFMVNYPVVASDLWPTITV